MRLAPLSSPFLACLCVLAGGCGGSDSVHPRPPATSDGGNTPDGGNDADAGAPSDGGNPADAEIVQGDGTPCGDYAAASCNSLSLCGPLFIRQAGGLDPCVARTKAGCTAALSYPSTGANATTLAKCTAALEATSPCGSTPACDFGGSLPVGATCGSGWQCSSGYCDGAGPTSSLTDGGIDWTFSCGTCAATLALGAACSTDSAPCSLSAQCVSTSASGSTTCQRYGGVGDPCYDSGFDQNCTWGLVCDATGHCTRGDGAGAKCVPDDHCDIFRDMFCNPTTGLCEQAKIAAVGGSCNSSLANGSIVNCAAGSTCLPAVGTDQHCMPNANLGDACDNINGPLCGGALCTGGVCTAMDPASCQ